VRKVKEFELGDDPTEAAIKDQLIEGLEINIFFSSMIKEYLFREYSDGLWKRIGLSFL
jgi:hypothetical protein